MKKEVMNYETLLKITHGIVMSKDPEEVALLIVE
ncbi:MAG: GAF domain-containing protein, partial [Deltaproteobacteria bacterium]|nr:GAF domain-containing protein [Deltaproteobacteria bacterium]